VATKTKDSVLAELAELGASLADAAEDEAKKQETLNKILGSIDGLDKETAKDLFKNEKVQRLIELASEELAESEGDLPGSIRSTKDGAPLPFAQKRPWTEGDLQKLLQEGKMKLVEDFMPITTAPVIWNGLRRNFVAMEPMTVASCFVDVYREHLAALKRNEEHVAWLFRKRNDLRDPSMLTEGGVRMRGSGDRGHYVPGGGNVAMDDAEGAGE